MKFNKIKRLLPVSMAMVMLCSNALNVSAATLQDLFDADYYSEVYDDLNAAFGDNENALWNHFLQYGIQEQRKGSPYFDVVAYRNRYPDLNAAFGDNWRAYYEHYINFGAKEGRNPFTEDFDPVAYAQRYPDLKAAFGDDPVALYRHYLTFGMKEGRNARSAESVSVHASNTSGETTPDVPDSPIVPEIPQEPPAPPMLTEGPDGILLKAGEEDVTAMSIDEWMQYEFHMDYAELFTNITSYSHEDMRAMLDKHWSSYNSLIPIPTNTLTDEEKREVLKDWHNTRVQLTPVSDVEAGRIYLWPRGQVPSITEYTENTGYAYADDPDFEPFMLEKLVPEGTEIKGAVVIAAGGGHTFRSNVEEGLEVAEALNELGYQCFIVNYRVDPYTDEESALDIARAVKLVRAHASQYGIRPDNIAAAGFSYGGIVTSLAADLYGGSANASEVVDGYEPDVIDAISADINAYLAIYSVTPEPITNPDTFPATFFGVGAEDGVSNWAARCRDLCEANGIKYEWHLFDGAPHGFGAGIHADGTLYEDAARWPGLADRFMQEIYGNAEAIPDYSGIVEKAGEPDVTQMSLDEWMNYEFHMDYAELFSDITAYSYTDMRQMLDVHWSSYNALIPIPGNTLTDAQKVEVLKNWHNARVSVQPVKDVEANRIYLWQKGQVPSTTSYTENPGYSYNDDPGFEPYMLEYLVPENVDPKGAVLICTGGSHIFRSNVEEGIEVAMALNTLGYQCFIVNYRINPYTMDESGLDVARAVRYVRAHADEYRIDENRIAAAGFSAGGSVITRTINRFQGNVNAGAVVADYVPDELDRVSADINAYLSIYANYGADELDTENAQVPPTFLAIGDQDGWRGMQQCSEALAAAGIRQEFHVFEGVPHGFGAGTHADGTVYLNASQWPGMADSFMQSAYAAEEPDYSGILWKAGEPDVTQMSLEDWKNYEFYMDYSTLFSDVTAYSYEDMRSMLDMHWSHYIAVDPRQNPAAVNLTDAERVEILKEWHNARVSVQPIKDVESNRIYLWPENIDVPSVTEFTDNSSYIYNDAVGFRPYMLECLVEDGVTPKGAVLICTGGSHLYRSNVEEGLEVAMALNDLGYQCFIVNYRINPYTYDESALDVSRAMRIVRANAEKYNIDPDRIAYAGFSAGGIVASLTADSYTGDVNASVLVDGYTPDAIDAVDATPNAYLAIYSVTPEPIQNPETFPATFFGVGSADSVQYWAARCRDEQIIPNGIEYEWYLFDGAPHGFGAGTHADGTLYEDAARWPGLADSFMQRIYASANADETVSGGDAGETVSGEAAEEVIPEEAAPTESNVPENALQDVSAGDAS